MQTAYFSESHQSKNQINSTDCLQFYWLSTYQTDSQLQFAQSSWGRPYFQRWNFISQWLEITEIAEPRMYKKHILLTY